MPENNNPRFLLPPFRLRAGEPFAAPPGWPPDVHPNELIASSHINAIRSSAYAWPGDVDGQNHYLRNVILENVSGVLADPTTTAGDLIARGIAGIGRLAIGADGQILTVDTTQPQRMKWAPLPAAPVASVFGRVGVVVAQAGDYSVSQITGAMADPTIQKGDLIGRGDTVSGRLPIGTDGQILTADAASPLGIRWAAPAVSSFNGRTGAIIPTAGDYTAMQITNAVSMLGTYADPPWITSFPWARLSGMPTTFTPAPHTHDATAIVSGVLSTARLGTGVADATVYLRGDGTWAGVSGGGGGGAVISVFGRAGNVVAQAGDYTAAMVTGAVTDPTTMPGDLIVRNNLNALVRLPIGANGQVLQTDSSLSVRMKWTTIDASVQTPWVTNVDAAGFTLFSVGRIAVGKATANYPIDIVGDINYTGVFRQNGVPVTFGGSQTPWTSDINGGNFSLFNVNRIGVQLPSTAATLAPIHAAAHTPGALGQITVQDLDATAAGNPTLLFTGIGSEGTRCFVIGNPGGTTYGKQLFVWNDRAGDLLFGTNGTERVRVTQAGYVGIGNNAAVLPDASTSDIRTIIGTAGAATMSQLNLISNAGVGATVGSFAFANYAITATDKRVAAINASLDGATNSGALSFFTWNAGSVGERVKIMGSGAVGINSSDPASEAALAKLVVTGIANQTASNLAESNARAVASFRANANSGYTLAIGAESTNSFPYLQAVNFGGGAAAAQLALQPFGGQVGISTPTPNFLLSLGSGLGDKLAIWDGGPGAIYGLGMQGGVLQIYTQSSATRVGIGYGASASFTETLSIRNGAVGIGKTDPPDGLTISTLGPSALAQLRMVWSSYGAMFRNDSGVFSLLLTNSGDPYGGWNGLRPLSVTLSNGNVDIGGGALTSMTKARVGASASPAADGDFAVSRNSAPASGVVYFGNTITKYLYFDGTNFNFSGGSLFVNGVPVSTGGMGVYVQNNAAAPVGPIQYLNFAPTGSISWLLTQGGTGGNTMTIASQYISDARLKTNVRDLIGGIPLIERLRPREFEYNGLANTAAGRRGVSLIAQELQEVAPASIETFRSKLNPDDPGETELYTFNPVELTMHLILAVQQLAARLTLLESKAN